MKKQVTGEIYRYIKSIDEGTIIRRTNMRTFCQKHNLDYTICQVIMLIDINSFLNALNTNQYTESN